MLIKRIRGAHPTLTITDRVIKLAPSHTTHSTSHRERSGVQKVSSPSRTQTAPPPTPPIIALSAASHRERVTFILDGKIQLDIVGYLHVGSGGSADWAVESAKLCLSMCKNFKDHGRDRAPLANFAMWASEDSPVCDGGVNFENAHYEVHAPVSTAAPMVCARKRKYPMRNSYASLPSRISYARSAVHVRRMHRFIATTLACTDGIRLLLSMYALVAAGVRLPDAMLFFAGKGGEGESPFDPLLVAQSGVQGIRRHPARCSKLRKSFASRGAYIASSVGCRSANRILRPGYRGKYPSYSALAGRLL